jgi:hypothetical protein
MNTTVGSMKINRNPAVNTARKKFRRLTTPVFSHYKTCIGSIMRPAALLLIFCTISIFPQGRELQFNFYYAGLITGYDFQSNGTPQQIWQDKQNPQNVHAVFMHSSEGNGWSDRSGKYFYSSDMGVSWNNMGNVQVAPFSRGGYPSITGLNDGRPVVGIHNNDSINPTRTQLYVRDFTGTSWNRYNPGPAAWGEPIWPRVVGVGSNEVVTVSSINGAPDYDILLNKLDLSTGSFTGWNSLPSARGAESYCIEKSEDESVIAVAYVGSEENPDTYGNLYYTESLDGGITWSDVLMIYQYFSGGDFMGVYNSVDMIFIGNNPFVVFDIVPLLQNTPLDTLPNKIMLWSPTLNDGHSFKLAESGVDVPFYHNYASDYFFPVCRPTIGRSAEGNALFVAMNVVTEHYYEFFPWLRISYFAGYIMYSLDAGENWSIPEKFTPESPLKDWRYVSISPTNAVTTNADCIIQMVMQADTVPGSNLSSGIQFQSVSAEMVCIRGSFLSDADDSYKLKEFYLSGNDPNPFNPETNIKFILPESADVKLTVYNILGKKVLDLINSYKSAGTYEINVDMSEHPSGIYICKMEAGRFSAARKMLMIK